MEIKVNDRVKVETITGGGYFGNVLEIIPKYGYNLYKVINSQGIIKIHNEFDVVKRPMAP
jgi:hypothetical protein